MRKYEIVHIFCSESTLQTRKSSCVCIPTSQKFPWDPQCSERAETSPDDDWCIKGQFAVLKDEAKYMNINSRSDYCFLTEHHYFGWMYIKISYYYLFFR